MKKSSTDEDLYLITNMNNPSPTTMKECIGCNEYKEELGRFDHLHWCPLFRQPSEEKECICTNVMGTTMRGDCPLYEEHEKIGVAPKQEEWEWKFDNFRNYDGKEYGHGIHQEIKSFISQLLKKEREKVIEEIDSWLKKDSEGTWELEGLYMRFKDYLRKLKK